MSSATLAKVTREAVEKAETFPKDSNRIVILARAFKAVLKILDSIEDSDTIASASSDFELLLSLLQEPGVRSTLSKVDPLANAKLRGIKAQLELLDREGGCIPADAAAIALGISKAAVYKARAEGRMIGIPRGQKHFVFPIWQFSSGKVLDGIKEVNVALHASPWMSASFLLSPNSRLNNEAPLSWLKAGRKEEVIKAAELYGEHGAV